MKEKIKFTNKRGLNLVGDFYKSDSEKGIIFLHGFTGDRHESGRFDLAAEILQEEGFNVLTFDFSGSGESDDEPLNTDNQAEDLRDAIDLFKSKGIKYLGVLGMSLGPIALLKNKNLFGNSIDAIVLWAPVTYKKDDYTLYRFSKEQINELKSEGKITVIKDIPGRSRKKLEVSKQIIEERENLNQKDFLEGINLPLLIVHGDEDVSVPLEWSKTAMNYLPAGSKLEILSGEGHSFLNKRNELVNLTLRWFKNNLRK